MADKCIKRLKQISWGLNVPNQLYDVIKKYGLDADKGAAIVHLE